jgi:hypothetical protein
MKVSNDLYDLCNWYDNGIIWGVIRLGIHVELHWVCQCYVVLNVFIVYWYRTLKFKVLWCVRNLIGVTIAQKGK